MNESQEDRNERLNNERVRSTFSRIDESSESRKRRVEDIRFRMTQLREDESAEAKRDRIANVMIRRNRRRCLNWENVGYNYDPFELYHLEDKIQINGMTVECNVCHAEECNFNTVKMGR